MKLQDASAAITAPTLPHRRQLNGADQQYLAKLLSNAFHAEVPLPTVEKIMNYISHVEKRMIGRMASHVEDLIIHYLMRYFSSLDEGAGDDAVHLEIGTLFGGTVLLAHHAIALAERRIPLHVIDPFGGYYGRGKDIITGEEICEENFLNNLDSLGIPREDVVIHKGLSTDEAIIESCQGLRLRSLLIDGDHSYNGVKNDWINFAHLVVPGGYVLIDNYNDQYWPEVMSYVNREVLPNTRGMWDVLLAYANSLLLRRTDVRDEDDALYSMKLYREIKARDAKCARHLAEVQEMEEAHRAKIDALIAAHDDSRETTAQLQEKVAEVEQGFRAEESRLHAQLMEKGELLESLMKERAEYRDKEELLKTEVAALQARYESEASSHATQRKTTLESIARLNQMQTMIDDLREAHRGEVVELHRELQKNNHTHHEELLRLQQTHTAELREGAARVEQLQTELVSVGEERAALKTERDLLLEDLAALRQQLRDETERLTGELREAEGAHLRATEALAAGHADRLREREEENAALAARLDRREAAHREELARLETAGRRTEELHRENLAVQESRLRALEALWEAAVASLREDIAGLHDAHAAQLAELRAGHEERESEIRAGHAEREAGLRETLREAVASHQAELQRLEAERQELRGELAAAEAAHAAEIGKLTSALSEAVAEHRRHRDDLERRLAEGVAELQALRDLSAREKEEMTAAAAREKAEMTAAAAREKEEMTAEAARKEAAAAEEVALLREEIREREQRIDDLTASLSWKITAPLRFIGKSGQERKKD